MRGDKGRLGGSRGELQDLQGFGARSLGEAVGEIILPRAVRGEVVRLLWHKVADALGEFSLKQNKSLIGRMPSCTCLGNWNIVLSGLCHASDVLLLCAYLQFL